ncbi:MAG: hypothetical protein BWZ10_03034 [candidate division BRC1 bacterium ADurb.BinA364]|nr:MAG: hypothetical protein BWZ10_03034 [candidate division BRC1 bacterium ADurb.BinA364]
MADRASMPAPSSSPAGLCRRSPRRRRRRDGAANGSGGASRSPRRCDRPGCPSLQACPGCGRRTDRSNRRRRGSLQDGRIRARLLRPAGQVPSVRCDIPAPAGGRQERAGRPSCSERDIPARAFDRAPSPCRRFPSSRRGRRLARLPAFPRRWAVRPPGRARWFGCRRDRSVRYRESLAGHRPWSWQLPPCG